jgi:murein DD-endopeptidase MepM/ murein hydrolase activator NlpD
VGIFIVLFSIFYTSHNSSELAQYQKVKSKSAQQKKQIYNLSFQIEGLKKDVEVLLEKEVELHGLMQPNRRSSSSSTVKEFNELYSQIEHSRPQVTGDSLTERLAFLSGEMKQLKAQFREHNRLMDQYKVRFASTPSIWPLYGRVQSDFGWRVHPISHVSQFHKGIDIPSWIGAPIRATAQGRVVATGYNSGYGLCVAIDHGYGLTTVYAHTSKIFVSQGEIVKKGQKIAAVGSTGSSTGPHVHYEVRKWQQAVSPRTYLDLNMYTANKEVW